MGHAKVLQVEVDEVASHALPPNAAATVTVRVFFLLPVPQLLEQAEKADQGVMTQSIGHGWALHVRPMCIGHSSPP